MKTVFTSPEVQGVIGAGREVFRSWVDLGFITPSIQRSTQQGEQNLFSRLDVYGAGLFKHLTAGSKMKRESAGYHVAVWRDMVNAIATKPTVAATLHSFLIFIRHGEDIVFCEPREFRGSMPDYINAIGQARQAVDGKGWDDILIINMRPIVEGIDKKLAKLKE
jgi:hypothetical protein